MKKKVLLTVPLLIIVFLIIYNCDKRENFSHHLPSGHPLKRIQTRLNEIINYSKGSIVKITGDKEIPTFFYTSQPNFRDWIIGTGFVFKKDDNYLYILSNYHVIENSKKIKITFLNNYQKEAILVGKDKDTDLVVLKVKLDDKLKNIKPLSIKDNPKLKEGDFIIVGGFPFNLDLSYTFGIVSALHVNPGISKFEDYIQLNSAINPGNSGGPVFDIYGYVIGVVVATIQYGQGIGFAIPSDTVKYISNEILLFGHVRRGWLGLLVENTSDFINENNKGVFVINVYKDSPAKKAGIKAGDIILSINGIPIKNREQFKKIEARLKPNSYAILTILREKKQLDVKVKVAENKNDEDDF